MKKTVIKNMALVLGATLLFSGCGSDSDDNTQEQQTSYPDLESAKQILYFYGANTNDHYAFDVTTNTLENLNDDNVTAMSSTDNGKLFYFRDNTTGDTNASNDVDKVLMFKSTYSFATDGNATWEDFYYLDHLHEGGRHPHANDEFNVTAGGKYTSMIRLNQYLAEQEQLKNSLESSITNESIVGSGQSAPALCDFYTVIHADENETHYFALGTNGKVYTFDDNTTNFKDVTLVSSAGCEVGKSGMVAAQDGVLVYLGSTSKLYLVDSHDDGVSHVHSEWDVSKIIGNGHGIDMMVGIGALEYTSEAHDH